MRRSIFEEELFKFKKVPFKKDDMAWQKKLLKGSLNGSYGSVQPKKLFDRRVTFKMSYSRKLRSHNKYLNYYMQQKNKDEVMDKPVLWGSNLSEYEAKKSALHFKFIISPEDDGIDIQYLTRKFILRVENLTGYKLLWEAAIHKDTAHPHAHVCINGLDATGQEIRFSKGMIKSNMREILSEISTSLIGKRNIKDIERQRQEEVSAIRWTSIDEELKDSALNVHYLPARLRNRLDFLGELGLVKYKAPWFEMLPEWEEVLKSNSRYNLFMQNWKSFGYNLKQYKGEKLEGTVIKTINFDRDESWNDAIIVKDAKGENHYVPVWQLQNNLDGKHIMIDQQSSKDGFKRISGKSIVIKSRKVNFFKINEIE